MNKSAFITARIEPKLKARASRVLAKVGVSTTDAITMFLRQVLLRSGLPFDVRVQNAATEKAIEELEPGRGETLRGRAKQGVIRPREKRKHPHPSIRRSKIARLAVRGEGSSPRAERSGYRSD
jgi:DNA-damage-inducible protein J